MAGTACGVVCSAWLNIHSCVGSDVLRPVCVANTMPSGNCGHSCCLTLCCGGSFPECGRGRLARRLVAVVVGVPRWWVPRLITGMSLCV